MMHLEDRVLDAAVTSPKWNYTVPARPPALHRARPGPAPSGAARSPP